MNGSQPHPNPTGATGSAEASLSHHAFGERFESAYRLLWVVAAGIVGNGHAAEDVVHEAALQALGRLDQYQPGTNFNAWMAQIVRYVALNYARKENRRRGAVVSGDQIETLPAPLNRGGAAPPSIDACGNMTGIQTHFDDEVLKALATLSETARACLLLRTVEGLEYREIAGILNIPQGTAMSHVHRSRHQLRNHLTDHSTAEPSRGDQGNV